MYFQELILVINEWSTLNHIGAIYQFILENELVPLIYSNYKNSLLGTMEYETLF